MHSSRRRFLYLGASAVVLSAISRRAGAQAYPTRPVHLILGFPPGGVTDIVARVMAQWMTDRLGQSVVVENRPGGGSNIAAQFVVSAPADGYTLLMVSGSNAVNATFYESLPFDFLRDIAPVAGLVGYPLVMVVNPATPVKTVAEYIAYAKDRPGWLTMASYGTGTTGHLTGELFQTLAGIKLVHVPYRGEALAMTDVMAGQVEMMFATVPGSIEHIKAGKLRALGVSTKMRSRQLPDVPPIAETVAGFEASSWNGLGVPRGTPAQVIDRLAREVNAGLADPGLVARLVQASMTPMPMSPAEFGKFLVDETEKWGKVVRAANIKPE
jgi:tripartite-type tricarboxylate transporter receptor subunit TctC